MSLPPPAQPPSPPPPPPAGSGAEPPPPRGRAGRLWAPSFPFAPASWPFFYGWVVVAAGTLGVVFSIPGQTMGVSVFTDILMAELGLTRVQLSAAYCVGTVLSGFTLPALGRLFDRVGARRMVVGAAVATGLVLFYLSQVSRLLDALSAAVPGLPRVGLALAIITLGFYLVRASAQGVLTMTSRNAIGKWFNYHRGTALALSGVFTSFGFSVAPRVLDGFIARFSWDGTWLLLGVLSIVVMGGVGWLFFRDNPEECGLVMDGPEGAGKRRELHADAVAHHDYSRAEALRTPTFWAFNLSFVFFALFSTAYTFHIVSLAEWSGRGRAEVLGFFIPMAVLSVASNLFCGWASSRTRLKFLLVAMNLAALAGVVGLLDLSSRPGAAAYIIGNGFCGGAFSALSGIVWPRFYGRLHLGAISGVGMASMVIASGVGPLLFGLSLSRAGSYDAVLYACAIAPALLALTAFWADNPQRAGGSS